MEETEKQYKVFYLGKNANQVLKGAMTLVLEFIYAFWHEFNQGQMNQRNAGLSQTIAFGA